MSDGDRGREKGRGGWWRLAFACGIIIAAGLASYWGSWRSGFVYDDDSFVVLNKSIRGLDHPARFFTSPLTLAQNPQLARDNYRPLTALSFALSYHWGGLDPRGYHLLNLLFHLLNGLLIFFLALRLASRSPGGEQRAVSFALIAALIFTIHPLQTETVDWVSQRSGILSLFFMLLSWHAWEKKGRPSRLQDAAALLLFAASLLFKEEAAIFPFILILEDWILRPSGGERAQPRLGRREDRPGRFRHLPFFLLILLLLALKKYLVGQVAQSGYWGGDAFSTVLTTLKGFVVYLKLLILPWPLSLEYLFPVSSSLSDPGALGGALLLSALALLALRLRKKAPLSAFGILLFFVGLGPVSNIIPIRTIINERFLYLPMLGFAFLAGDILSRASFPRARRGLAFGFLILCAALTFARSLQWRNAYTLLQATLETCPQSARAHYGMAKVYGDMGEWKKAEDEISIAMAIDPDYDKTLRDLGILPRGQKDREERLARYRKTVQVRVEYAPSLFLLGSALLHEGKYAAAVKALEAAEKASPGHVDIETNLAVACARDGKLSKAVRILQELVKNHPGAKKAGHDLALFSAALEKSEAKAAPTLPSPNLVDLLLRKFPEMSSRLEAARGAQFEPAKILAGGRERRGISLKRGFLGSSQSEGSLKPEERAALASLAGREGADPNAAPAFFLPKRFGTVSISLGQARLDIHPKKMGNRGRFPSARIESGVVLYPKAYPGTDVLYAVSPGALEEMYWIAKPGPKRFEKEITLNGSASKLALKENKLVVLDASGREMIALSPPKVMDSRGKSVPGKYELTEKSGRFLLTLSFDDAGLRYPLLIDPAWVLPGALNTARYAHTATLLPNGQVLVAGGYNAGALSSAELYNPATGAWTTTGNLNTARYVHTATLLPNGQVLVAGGAGAAGALSSAELYNPATGAWTTTGNLNVARNGHTATLLPNGQVLVAGGNGTGGTYLSSAELYTPATGVWKTTGNLNAARYYYTATLLPNGQVLVAGGTGTGGAYLSSAELYNPATGLWSTTGNLNAAHEDHTATLLPNGQVLVTGGYNGTSALSSAELYNPATGAWTTTGNLNTARYGYTATLLPNGQVLVEGGYNAGALSSAELALYTEYNYAAVSPTIQPSITTIGGAANTPPVSISAGTTVAVTGSLFTGISEASGGNGAQNSPANLPHAFLMPTDSGGIQTGGQSNEELIDLSTGIYNHPISSTSLSVDIPANLNTGYYLFWIQSNAVPSTFTIVNVLPTCSWVNPASCQTVENVSKSTLPTACVAATTISSALASLPTTLGGNACVVIRDTSTYSEQVSVQGFAFTYSTDTLSIMADPTFISSQPVVNPPALSTAAFDIINASVTIQNIAIVSTNAVSYGVYASSAYATLNQVYVSTNGAAGQFTSAGIAISSYSSVLNSSVTLNTPSAFSYGFWLTGSSSTISGSTASVNSANDYALYLNGASSSTITQDYISNPNGYGARLDTNADYNTISLSTITSNASGYIALYLGDVSSNTITQDYISAPNGTGARLDINANYNTISLSTITNNGSSDYALYLVGNASNTITQDYILSGGGIAAILSGNANYNTISQSTINAGGISALYLTAAPSNIITQDYVSATVGYGAYLETNASYNTISLSTITSNALNYVALYLGNTSSNTILNSYVQGSTAAYVFGSTGTVIGGSVFVATNTTGSGLWLAGGSMNLALTTNTITGGPEGAGIYIDQNNSGLINLSTNNISGSPEGIYIATQSAGTQIWIASNTILPAIPASGGAYGIYLNGLTTGATIYNNGIYYRSPGGTSGQTYYGLNATSTQGLYFHHNRINNPGMITAGSYIGAYFNSSTGNAFKFNDVNSTGTNLTDAYLIQLAASTVTIRDNIFLSSVTVSGSSASFTADATSGFNSDYNDWFSSNSANAFIWGTISTTSLAGWQSTSGADANSIADNPLWFNSSANIEDFHPMSAGSGSGTGRCSAPQGDYPAACTTWAQDSLTSLTIDAADSAETTTGPDGLGHEPAPNGCLPNQGSTGQTDEASTSVQELAVKVSTNFYNFTPGGTSITMGVGVSTISVSSITVFNAGNSTETYELSGATVTPNSIWTLTSSTQPSVEHPVLEALFQSTQPVSTDFNIVTSSVDNSTQICGVSGGNYADGQSGANVPSTQGSNSLGLWFKLFSPTASIYGGTTSANSKPQEIQVTVTAIPSGGGVCTN